MGDPFTDYLSEDYSYFSEEEWNETPREREARKVREVARKAREAAPGSCPKCGKHIGRGVHFHAKACNG